MGEMKVGHTPGPWTFREFMGSPEQVEFGRKHGIEPVPALTNDGARIMMADGVRIGTVDSQTEFKRGKGHEVVCAERDANATLIAAAPELLAALLALADRVAVVIESDADDGKPEDAELRTAWDAAGVAIAKAEGR